MNIAIGADENLEIIDTILEWLQQRQIEFTWHGPEKGVTVSWSEVAIQVAENVIKEKLPTGILLCWTGTGMSIAANKIPGIRAALCDDAETARGARLWNDANVLCLSMRTMTKENVTAILHTWFNTKYEAEPSDAACIASITAIEEKYSKD